MILPLRRRNLVVTILTSLSLLAVGCVRVKPYQRENLSRRDMIEDHAPGEARFTHHVEGAREGAEGGTGEPGGGCGCN